jgi:acetyltransferase-like isoleucine patch superfamily enzyme
MNKSFLRKGKTLFRMSPKFLKINFLRKRGPVGENFTIGKNSILYARKLKIGNNVTIGANTNIITDELILEDNCSIGNNCSIENIQLLQMSEESIIAHNVEVGGMQTSKSNLQMGKRSVIFSHCFINTTREVFLGDESCIGGYSIVMTHSSWSSKLDGYPVQFAPVTIKENVYIPWKVFIFPGVTIGEGSVIGGGSYVTKDVPAKSLAVGTPAKIVKSYNEIKIKSAEKIQILKDIIRDFEDYLKHVKRLNVQIKILDDYGMLSCQLENTRQVMFIFNQKIPEKQLVSGDVVVSLDTIPKEKCNELSRKNICWLDLETKTGRINRKDRWTLWVRGFLVRYGIRVELIK